MTPFGEHLRHLRRKRGVSQKEMAAALDVSPAYLSALEHGKRGRPSYFMVQRIVGYFNVIWDEAEKLQKLAQSSDPKVMVDTRDLSSKATHIANLFQNRINKLNDDELERIGDILTENKH